MLAPCIGILVVEAARPTHLDGSTVGAQFRCWWVREPVAVSCSPASSVLLLMVAQTVSGSATRHHSYDLAWMVSPCVAGLPSCRRRPPEVYSGRCHTIHIAQMPVAIVVMMPGQLLSVRHSRSWRLSSSTMWVAVIAGIAGLGSMLALLGWQSTSSDAIAIGIADAGAGGGCADAVAIAIHLSLIIGIVARRHRHRQR